MTPPTPAGTAAAGNSHLIRSESNTHGSDNEPREYTVALIELKNGKMVSYQPERVTFLEPPPVDCQPLMEAPERDTMPTAAGPTVGDLFRHQFPAGLPIGLTKPHVVLKSQAGTQVIQFEDAHDIGVIRTGVYPSLTFAGLQAALNGTPFARTALDAKLASIIQTPTETTFFQQYAATHKMFTDGVPVLVPQAWIQWHSLKKDDLRSAGSSYAADLYRIDFVVFWQNRRYAILIDDISHYATKGVNRWDANEKEYSNRLKEDRKLRKEGWDVFRISNWEIRSGGLPEILTDLKEFLRF